MNKPATDELDEAEFQGKVLNGLETTRKKMDAFGADIGRLDAATKKVGEEITALQKVANDSDAGRKELLRKFGELEGRLKQQAFSSFGNPIARISANEELRLRINAAVRLAVNNNSGDMTHLVRTGFPKEFVTKAIGEDSGFGSTLINTELYREIYDTLAMYGTWNTFGVRRVGTKLTKFPVKTARAAANWILTEAGTISDDANKAGTTQTLQIETAAVLLNVSLQLIQDAEFDVTADVLNDFGEAYALLIDNTVYNANGASDATNGGYTGVINFGTAAVAAAGNTTVETLQEEDMRAALLAVDPVVLNRKARWWIHPQILVRLLSIKDKQGRSIFLNMFEAPSPGGIGSIYGYPVTLAFAAPNTDSAGQPIAIFGDPDGMVVGMRQDFAFEATDAYRWNTYERSFRGVGRAGIKGRRSQAFAVVTTAAT